MTKRILALLCALLLPAVALGEIAWPSEMDAGQAELKAYIDQVNVNQAQQNHPAVNSLFECYPSFATLGITAQDMAEIPEGVEMTFALEAGHLDSLTLRVSDPSRFAALAASCIQAASPETTLEDALADPAYHANKATNSPTDSFEDQLELANGLTPRVYYAYFPNQYKDGVDWLQMTLVFPMPGAEGSSLSATPVPGSAHTWSDSEYDTDYDGYDFDGGTHLELFATATPEPDSPAGEAE